MNWPRMRSGFVVGTVVLIGACDNAGVDLGFGTNQTNVVRAIVYLDRDGSRAFSAPTDTFFVGARIALLQRGTDDTVKSALTNAQGVALITDVPLGEYTVAVGDAGLGDSIHVTSVDTTLVPSNQPTTTIKLSLLRDTTEVLVRLSYPEVTLAEARTTPPGKQVFIRGLILAGVQSFRDTTSHVADATAAIRLTRVSLRNASSNPPGDSVSVLGRTSSRLGQPTLDRAVITKLGSRPAPLPLIVATGTAATASNGTLDAALVQIQNGVISDTVTIAPDYRVTVSDGTGSLSIVLDANINFNRTSYLPGKRVNARGVLVPNGAGGWSLKPREVGDAVAF